MCRYILCIDQATQNTAYTVLKITEDKKFSWVSAGVLQMRNRDPIKRIAELCDKLEQIYEKWKPDTFVLEEVPLMKKTELKSSLTLIKLLGIMELWGFQHDMEVVIQNVNRWKNLAGIKSKTRDAQKKEGVALAMKRWKNYAELMIDNDDLSDALLQSQAWLIENKYMN